MHELRLAWRNLWRNRTRTIIAVTAISLSFAALLATFGLSDATYVQVLQVAVKTAGGSVLIHADGWQKSRASDLFITDPAAIVEAARKVPGVKMAIPRIIVQGLLSSAHGSEAAQLSGVDPQSQAMLLDLSRFVDHGDFVAPGEKHPLVIGDRLAEKLRVKLGDRVVLTATDKNGDLARALFRVSGIFRPHSGLEQGVAFTSVEAAADAMGIGLARTEIGLVLDDDARRGEVARALEQELPRGGQRLEVLTWDQALPELIGAIRADKSFAWLFGLVVFVVMGFGIANTFLMSVLERVRELGLLAALGLTPARTARLVLAETVVLTAFSVAVGYTLALMLHWYLHRWGIDVAALSGMKIEVSGVMVEDLRLRSVIDPLRWVIGGVGVVLIVVLSASYPAWRASRLDPVQAMRTYE